MGMESIIADHGGIIGVLAVVVILLAKELVGTRNKNTSTACPNPKLLEKLMTKELCLERHGFLEKQLETGEKRMEKIDKDLEYIKQELFDLPRKINGQSKKREG